MRKYLLAAAMAFGTVSFVLACSTGGAKGADAKVFEDARAPGTFGASCVTDTAGLPSSECANEVLSGVTKEGPCTNSFNMSLTPLCSLKCTMFMAADPTECPVGSDGQAFCNMKGFCKP
jgi:hypothetical protein